MEPRIHPAVTIIKNEIVRGKYRYEDVSSGTAIPVQRLKNIMVGRSDMTMRERDKLCDYLKISPVVVVMRRDDLFKLENHLDLSVLPEGIRKSLIVLYNEIYQLCSEKTDKKDV